MCGRFSQAQQLARTAQVFGFDTAGLDASPRYNIAPSQTALAVWHDRADSTQAGALRFGFEPGRPLAGGRLVINARCETAAVKPMFRNALQRRRCIVPVDGFYEWQRSGQRQPFRFAVVGDPPFALAAIWQTAQAAGKPYSAFCLLTTAANDRIAPVHDRMPVILRRQHWDLWLDRTVTDPQMLAPIFEPYPPEQMTSYAVSRRVNNPVLDDASLILPVDGSTP